MSNNINKNEQDVNEEGFASASSSDNNSPSTHNNITHKYDEFLRSSNYSEKVISDITAISKKLSISYDAEDTYVSSDDEKKDYSISDLDEVMSPSSEISTEELVIPEPEKKAKAKNFYFKSTIYVFLFVFCFTFISFTYIFNYVFIPIKVKGISMQPTLNLSIEDNGYYEGNLDETHCDIVYYNKDKTYHNNDIVIIKNNGYVKDHNTENSQDNQNSDEVEFLIKRVVAKEYQTIKFIKSDTQPSHYKTNYTVIVLDQNGKEVNLDKSFEANGEEMYFYQGLIEGYSDMFPFYYEIFSEVYTNGEYSYTIPKNNYFVMGDNRNNSTDSRFFGTVKYDDIEGEVKLMVYYNQSLLKAIFTKLKSYI